MRFPELLEQLEVLYSDFAWLCDHLAQEIAGAGGDTAEDSAFTVLTEMRDDYSKKDGPTGTLRTSR